jgi:hypothetical protein
VHGRAADQDAVGLLQVIRQLILIGELIQTLLRNIVETGIFKHITSISFSFLFQNDKIPFPAPVLVPNLISGRAAALSAHTNPPGSPVSLYFPS